MHQVLGEKQESFDEYDGGEVNKILNHFKQINLFYQLNDYEI